MSLLESGATPSTPVGLVDLTALWGQVVEELSTQSPQNRGFLKTTQPIGLLQRENGASFLLEAPNQFTKDYLEVKVKAALNEILSQKFNQSISIAVQVNESLNLSTADVIEVDATTPVIETHRQGTGRGADTKSTPVSYTHLTLPTIYSV